MSRKEPQRYRPVPDRDVSNPQLCHRDTVVRKQAELIAQLEHDLITRDAQVLSLQVEVRRLTALLPRELRKSHPKPTRREKLAMNGSAPCGM